MPGCVYHEKWLIAKIKSSHINYVRKNFFFASPANILKYKKLCRFGIYGFFFWFFLPWDFELNIWQRRRQFWWINEKSYWKNLQNGRLETVLTSDNFISWFAMMLMMFSRAFGWGFLRIECCSMAFQLECSLGFNGLLKVKFRFFVILSCYWLFFNGKLEKFQLWARGGGFFNMISEKPANHVA